MKPSTRRVLKFLFAALVVAFIAVQFVPVARTNRLGWGDPDAPREVQWVLRRACYDCHSTETRWPIWAYVAPMSWLVVRDVDRARAKLNFSDWASYDSLKQIGLRSMVGPLTAAHRMPLWYYVTLHPDARLTQAEIVQLQAWSRSR
jgi:hypothetical protein